MTNSACYPPITSTTASWLSAVYYYDPAIKNMKPRGGAAIESPTLSGGQYGEMEKWFQNLMQGAFS